MPISNSKSHNATFTLGIRANLSQFILQLLQVFFVGLTLGMTRTVVPAVAEKEFGLPKNSVELLVTFVIAFGVVKGVMNFVAGRISERLGRKRVLVMGWVIALPIPFMIRFGPSWGWIVAATVLLGINQGLTWSMALTSKLDLTRPNQRGLANGLNEFFGYFAVAVAGVVTAYMSEWFGARMGLFIFGISAIIPALTMALLFVRDTRLHNDSIAGSLRDFRRSETLIGYSGSRSDPAMDRVAFFAICQAGLVEKFTDSLIWILPVFLSAQGLDLPSIGWITGVYATVWGVSQLFTGPLSDRIGRRIPIVAGMYMCCAGVALMSFRESELWWSSCAAITGLGMGLLYPTLGAAVADIAQPSRRGATLGLYRFWRDLGYGIGALGLGLAVRFGETHQIAFWFVSACMAVSGFVFMIGWRSSAAKATDAAASSNNAPPRPRLDRSAR